MRPPPWRTPAKFALTRQADFPKLGIAKADLNPGGGLPSPAGSSSRPDPQVKKSKPGEYRKKNGPARGRPKKRSTTLRLRRAAGTAPRRSAGRSFFSRRRRSNPQLVVRFPKLQTEGPARGRPRTGIRTFSRSTEGRLRDGRPSRRPTRSRRRQSNPRPAPRFPQI